MRRGDTLSDIARRFNMTLAELRDANGMGPRQSVIHAGQTLRVAGGEPSWYEVRRGDTLSDIARAHGLTVSVLRKLNGIPHRSSVIRVGQKLQITAGSTPHLHIVRRGDTLGRIATRYRVRLNDLLDHNNLTLNSGIHPGQRLRIP